MNAWLMLQERPGGMSFTIIRPGGLKNDPASGKGVLTENTKVCGAINREDAAGLIVKALFAAKADNKVGVPEACAVMGMSQMLCNSQCIVG